MAEPWLTRDYSGWWRLPEPLPPARWPRVLMWLLVGLIALGAAIAHAQTGNDDVRALVCVIDRKDGRPCKLEDAEALARIEAREAARAEREAERRKRELNLQQQQQQQRIEELAD